VNFLQNFFGLVLKLQKFLQIITVNPERNIRPASRVQNFVKAKLYRLTCMISWFGRTLTNSFLIAKNNLPLFFFCRLFSGHLGKIFFQNYKGISQWFTSH